MWKLIGGVFVGIFLGALAVELIKRTRPELLEGIENGARTAADILTSSFRDGYRRGESGL
jgi:hypothetical protein